MAAESHDTQKSLLEQALATRAEWAKQQPSLGAQLQAMLREGAKDVHNTMDQVFFGQQPGMGEPGTPLVPTQAMITKDLGTVHGYQSMLEEAAARPSPAQEVNRER